MKRCPECRRDYYDDTLVFCLDDGAHLLEGPATGETKAGMLGNTDLQDEPETAILTNSANQTPTKLKLSETERTKILTADEAGKRVASSSDEVEKITGELPQKSLKKVWLAALAAGVLVIGGFFGYRYFTPAPSKQIDSIAVMPFVNASGNADNEYLSDGLTESLINSLSRLPGLAVKARSTVFRYKGKDITSQQIGSELSVQAVLNGRMVQRGDQLTLSLDLVMASTGDQIWGQQYNRKISDLVSLQSELANEISQKLRTNISPKDRQTLARGSTTNPEAYQLYLKGNYFSARYTKEGTQKGLDYYKQAIDLDPGYALAYNGLAYYYTVAHDWYLPAHEAIPKARESAMKALEIDDSLAAAHASLGVVKDWWDWDWPGAEREYKRAIDLDPNDPRSHQFYSLFLAKQGRGEEAIIEAKRAQHLDPVSNEAGLYLGMILLFVHQYDEAIETLRKTVEIDDTYFYTHCMLGRAYAQTGRLPEAIAQFQRAVQLEPANAEALSWLGHGYAISGNKAEALKVVEALKELSRTAYVSPNVFAIVYAGLGDKGQVFTWLERAYDERLLGGLTVDEQWDPYRSDPRFKALVKKVGLPH